MRPAVSELAVDLQLRIAGSVLRGAVVRIGIDANRFPFSDETLNFGSTRVCVLLFSGVIYWYLF